MICDGYAAAKPLATPNKTPCPSTSAIVAGKQNPVMPRYLSPVRYGSSTEARFFHHFESLACLELLDSPDLTGCAFPLAHQDEALRRTMAAVGAAHHFFICKGSGNMPCQAVNDLYFESFTLYNQAIASLTGLSSVSQETVLLCCLLFICYESMVGRYAESLKHLKAGLRLLASHRFDTSCGISDLMRAVFDLFAHIGNDFSQLMENNLSPSSKAQAYLTQVSCGTEGPFHALHEAANELRQMDLEATELMSNYDWSTTDGAYQTPPECLALNARFVHWGRRFDLAVEQLSQTPLHASDAMMILNLRLQQGVWRISMHLDDPEANHPAINESCEFFIRHAEPVAEHFISLRRPTFAVEGDLISGLSLALAMTTDKGLQRRAFDMLDALDRREGGWDSRDIAEMHRARFSQEDPTRWDFEEIPGGLPGFVKMLSVRTSAIRPENGLLWLDTESMQSMVEDMGL